jgi:hypothetical protein
LPTRRCRERRETKKRREKEEVVKNYYEIQTKKLEIEEISARAAAKKVDTKRKEPGRSRPLSKR